MRLQCMGEKKGYGELVVQSTLKLDGDVGRLEGCRQRRRSLLQTGWNVGKLPSNLDQFPDGILILSPFPLFPLFFSTGYSLFVSLSSVLPGSRRLRSRNRCYQRYTWYPHRFVDDRLCKSSQRGPSIEHPVLFTLYSGKRHSKSHTLCRRCGNRSFHIQKKSTFPLPLFHSSPFFPSKSTRSTMI